MHVFVGVGACFTHVGCGAGCGGTVSRCWCRLYALLGHRWCLRFDDMAHVEEERPVRRAYLTLSRQG